MSDSPITSRQNQRVKDACALRNRQHREALSQTLVYGTRETRRALAAGASLQLVFECPELLDERDTSSWHQDLRDAGVERLEVSKAVFEKLAYGDRHDGVVAVVNTQPRSLDDLALPENPLVAVVERVEKPGNLGAILRSADGAGVDAVVVADPVIDLFNPNTIRASVAMVFQRNVCQATAEQTKEWLAAQGITPFAAAPEAQLPYHQAAFDRPSAIVLGNEAQGLSPLWTDSPVVPVALPMLGLGDSLNVSATAAVLFYEARRQRDKA